MKSLAKKIMLLLPPYVRQFFIFIYRLGYIPNFKNPKTYNEKLNYRKLYWTNPLFVKCADKVAAKEYVRDVLGDSVIIENYFVGDSICAEKLKSIIQEKNGVLIKANHNSGPVFLLDINSTNNEIEQAVSSVMQQLGVDYGAFNNEGWYREIKPKVLVERRLYPDKGDSDLRDYKFHVFNQGEGRDPIVILHIDFNRFTNHSRSYFDEDLNYLPFSAGYPSIVTTLGEVPNYMEMFAAAKKLAKPFSYVRVDFYSLESGFYFGEMTFAPGSGGSRFTNRAYDLWMGQHWVEDLRN